jgi:hypothetical protein
MHDWAVRPNDWNSNLIVLGDFDLDRIGDPPFDAFISTGHWPPAELNAVPRTISDDDKTKHVYNRLARFSKPDGTSLLRGPTHGQRAGTFDFIQHIRTQPGAADGQHPPDRALPVYRPVNPGAAGR